MSIVNGKKKETVSQPVEEQTGFSAYAQDRINSARQTYGKLLAGSKPVTQTQTSATPKETFSFTDEDVNYGQKAYEEAKKAYKNEYIGSSEYWGKLLVDSVTSAVVKGAKGISNMVKGVTPEKSEYSMDEWEGLSDRLTKNMDEDTLREFYARYGKDADKAVEYARNYNLSQAQSKAAERQAEFQQNLKNSNVPEWAQNAAMTVGGLALDFVKPLDTTALIGDYILGGGNFSAEAVAGNRSLISGAQSMMRNEITKDIQESTEGTWMDLSNPETNVGKGAKFLLGDNLGTFLYNMGYSTVQSMAIMGTMGKYGTILMGSNAGTDAVLDELAKGNSSENALAIGIINGVAEWATERFITLEHVLKPVNGVKQLPMNLLKSALSEGSEEVASGMIDTIADILINKDRSDIAMKTAEYLAAGDTNQQAIMHTVRDVLSELFQEGISGALSGAIMTGSTTALNEVQSNAQARSDVREIQSNGGYKTFLNDLNASDYMKDKTPMTEETPLKEVAKNYRGAAGAMETSAIKKRLVAEGMDEKTAESVSKVIFDKGNGYAVRDSDESLLGSPQAQKVLKEYTDNADWVKQARFQRYVATTPEFRAGMDKVVEERKKTAQEYIDFRREETLRTAKEFGLDIEEILSQHTDLSPERYDKAIRTAFEYGSMGLKLADVAETTGLDVKGVLTTAYEKGLEKYTSGRQNAQTIRTKVAGNVDFVSQAELDKINPAFREVDVSKLTDLQKEHIKFLSEFVAPRINRRIRLFEGAKGVNGQRTPEAIYLNVNGAFERGQKPGNIIGIFMHEFGHDLRADSQELFDKLRQIVINDVYGGDITKFNKAVEDYIKDRYNVVKETKEGANIDPEFAAEEIVCDSLAKIAESEESLRRVFGNDKTIAQKLLDFFKKIVSDIKEYFGGQNRFAKMVDADAMEKMVSVLQEYVDSIDENLTYDAVETTPITQNVDGVSMAMDVNDSVKGSDIADTVNAPKQQLSMITEYTPQPKENVVITAGEDSARKPMDIVINGKKFKGKATVRELRDARFAENGYTPSQIKKINKFIDQLRDFFQESEEKYVFVGLKDINHAQIIISPTTGEIVLSGLVKNGEYKINFDFTKTCKKRIALQQVIEQLAREKGKVNADGTVTEVDLSEENIRHINEVLASYGIETACLCCFVESKRYAMQSLFQETVVDVWNRLVDEVNASEGKAPVDSYFDFADKSIETSEIPADEYDKLYAQLTEWRKSKTPKGENKEEKMRRFLETTPSARKKLRLSDFVTESGRTNLHKLYPDIESLAKQKIGNAIPKAVESFAPYNGEIELMSIAGGQDIETYVRHIAGARSQSFSDFLVSHLFDVIQKTAGLAARHLTAHTYTKEISRAVLTGMTGEKINMSVLHDIDPNVDSWSAGLKADGSYFLSDYRAFKNGEANQIESIPDIESIALQNDPRYSKDCGRIIVGFSYRHYVKALLDPETRQMIGYHTSQLPIVIKAITNLGKATDYTAVQNTLRVNRLVTPNYEIPSDIPSYATPPQDIEKINPNKPKYIASDLTFDIVGRYTELKKTMGGAKAARQTINELLEFANKNHLAFDTTTAEKGYGEFDLYGDLDKTQNPYDTVDNYIEYCISKGYLPFFYEFSTFPDYYKQVYDFNVFDRLSYNPKTGLHESYAPQTAVHMLDENGKLSFPDNFFELADKYMSDYNYQRQDFEQKLPDIMKDVRKIKDNAGKPMISKSQFSMAAMSSSETPYDDLYGAEERLTRAENQIYRLFDRTNPQARMNKLTEILEDAGLNLRANYAEGIGYRLLDSAGDIVDGSEVMLSDYGGSPSSRAGAEQNFYKKVKNFLIESRKKLSAEQVNAEYMNLAKKYTEGDKSIGEVLQWMVTEAGAKRGYTQRLYHGTPNFGFTYVDFSYDKDKFSFWTFDNLGGASTYSGMRNIRRLTEQLNFDDMSFRELADFAESVGLDDEYQFVECGYRESPSDYMNKAARVLQADIATMQYYLSVAHVLSDEDYDFLTEIVSEHPLQLRFSDEDIDRLEEIVESLNLAQYRGSYDDVPAYYWDAERFDNNLKMYSKIPYGDGQGYAIYNLGDDSFIHSRQDVVERLNSEDFSAGNYELLGDTTGFYEVDAANSYWNDIPLPREMVTDPNCTTAKTRYIARWARDHGYPGVIIKRVYDSGGATDDPAYGNIYIFFNENGVKSADPVTYDMYGNIIPLDQRFTKDTIDIRYSQARTITQSDTFYSKMERTIEQWKGDKFDAHSIITRLTNNGVKAAEIKWSGLQQFLAGKKSVTKADLLDFVRKSSIRLEEVVLNQNNPFDPKDPRAVADAIENARNGASDEILGMFGDGKIDAAQLADAENSIEVKDEDGVYVAYATVKGKTAVVYKYVPAGVDETRWSKYVLSDGERYGSGNYHEYLFKLPNATYTNRAMQTHWGKDAAGIIAHVRVEDRWDAADERVSEYGEVEPVLFIEEIQSDWDNARMQRERYEQTARYLKGYYRQVKSRENDPSARNNELLARYLDGEYDDELDALNKMLEKTGFGFKVDLGLDFDSLDSDAVSGDEQWQFVLLDVSNRERMNESKYLSEILAPVRELYDMDLQQMPEVPDAPFLDGQYVNYVVKKLIHKAAEDGYNRVGWTTGKQQEERWSSKYAAAYRVEYDEQIPNAFNKFGKPYGVKATHQQLRSGETVWMFDLTNEMKKSVIFEGQTLYSMPRIADNTTIKSGSLFSGGGLLEQGLEYQLLTHDFGVEIVPSIAATWKENNGDGKIYAGDTEGDVNNFDGRKYRGKMFHIHASPVCHNLSPAKHGWGEQPSDIESAKKTLQIFLDAAAPVYTVENAELYEKTQSARILKEGLEKAGYTVDIGVYDSADYGSAQSRRRTIIRAVRADLTMPARPRKLPRAMTWDRATRDLWDGLTEVKVEDIPASYLRAVRNTGIDITKVKVPTLTQQTVAGGKVTYAVEGEQCKTLTTKCDETKLLLPGGKIYQASTEFLGRLMGLPDDFKYPHTKSGKTKTSVAAEVIGNGIPVELTKAVVGGILESAYQQTYGQQLYSIMRTDNGELTPRQYLAAAAMETTRNEQEKADLQEIIDRYDDIAQQKESVENRIVKLVRQTDKKAQLLADLVAAETEEAYRNHENVRAAMAGYIAQHYSLAESLRKAQEEVAKKIAQLKEELKQARTDEGMLTRTLHELITTPQIESIIERQRQELLRNRKQLEETKESAKERIAKLREQSNERRAKDYYMPRLIDTLESLYKDVAQSPEPLRAPVYKFLKSFDFLSRGKAGEVRDVATNVSRQQLTAALSELYEGDKTQNLESWFASYDVEVSDEIKEWLNALRNQLAQMVGEGDTISVRSLTSEQLKMVYHLAKSIDTIIRQGSKAYTRANLDMTDISNEVHAETERLGKRKKDKVGHLEKFMRWDNATPVTVLDRMGKGGQSLFRILMDGQDKLAFNWQTIVDYAKNWDKKEIRQWRKDTVEVRIGKETIEMTPAQMMALYCTSKDPDGYRHLIEGGGFKLSARKIAKGKDILDEARHLTDEDLKNLRDAMTKYNPKLMEFADSMQNFIDEVGARWGNQVSIKRFGYEQFTEESYFPITTVANNTPEIKLRSETAKNFYGMLNQSFTKPRTPNANNAVVIGDIFDIFCDHMGNMAIYNAFALPVLDTARFLNFAQRDENGDVEWSIHEELDKAFGSGMMVNYIHNLLNDINGEQRLTNAEDLGLMALRLRNRVAVAANFRVAIQQPFSITRALDVIGAKYFKPFADPKAVYQEMLKYSGIAVWKKAGNYDADIKMPLKNELIGADTQYGEMVNKVTEYGMKAAEMGDTITWVTIWNACKNWVNENQPGLEGDAYYKAVSDKFDDVIMRTQVVDSVLEKSQLMRQKTFFARMVSAFKSEPTMNYNMLLRQFDRFVESRQAGTLKQDWAKLRGPMLRSFATFALTAIVNALVVSAMDALRDDDDYEDWWEKFREALFGEYTGKKTSWQKTQEFLKSNIFGSANPVELPWISDMLSVLQGYDPDRVDVMAVEELVNSVNAIQRVISNPSYKDVFKLVDGASKISGLPIANLTRDVVAMWNSTFGAMDSSVKLQQSPESPTSGYEHLYSAMSNGETVKAAMYVDEIMDNVGDQAKAYTGITTQIRKAYKDGKITADEAFKYMEMACDYFDRERTEKQLRSQIEGWRE